MRAGRTAIAAATALALALAACGSASGATPTIGGCSVFPAFSGAATDPSAADQSAWNQDVSQAPVTRNSGKVIAKIQSEGGHFLHPDFGSNPNYGIPFTTANGLTPDVQVVFGSNGYPDQSDFGVGNGAGGPDTAPIPPTTPVEAGSDHHALVLDTSDCADYEMYRAKKLSDTKWQADSTALFDFTQSTLTRPDGWTSADAAGLPILPGLVRYGEVSAAASAEPANGTIDHAIRVTFDVTRRAYIHPATHFASSSCNRYLPPMGMRLRLKQSYYEAHLGDYPQGSESRVIFNTLYHYGLINADNGSNWFISGQTNTQWDDNDLDRLKAVSGRAFAVVKSAARTKTPC